MSDTTHPIDAAIEAMKELIDVADAMATDANLCMADNAIDNARAALPALTAYREGMKPTAPTREEAIEAIYAAFQSCGRQPLLDDLATAAYDALLAMGAIQEPRTITEQINDVTNAIMAGE